MPLDVPLGPDEPRRVRIPRDQAKPGPTPGPKPGPTPGPKPGSTPGPRRIPAYRLRMMTALAVVVILGFILGVLLPTHV